MQSLCKPYIIVLILKNLEPIFPNTEKLDIERSDKGEISMKAYAEMTREELTAELAQLKETYI